MAGKDSSDRSLRIASMTTMLDYHWMFLRTLSSSVREYLGEAGLAALERGFRRAGYSRGQRIRDRPETFAQGRDALSLIRNWDMGDHAMAAETGSFAVSGTAARATVTLPHVPGADYFSAHAGGDILEPYWRNTLTGMAEGYDAATGGRVLCRDIGPEHALAAHLGLPGRIRRGHGWSHQRMFLLSRPRLSGSPAVPLPRLP